MGPEKDAFSLDAAEGSSASARRSACTSAPRLFEGPCSAAAAHDMRLDLQWRVGRPGDVTGGAPESRRTRDA